MAKKTDLSTKANSKVASIICDYVNRSAKTQSEIARNMGYQRPNNISMLKAGLTRLPYSRVASLCEETGGDPKYLLIAMIEEYDPEILSILHIKNAD